MIGAVSRHSRPLYFIPSPLATREKSDPILIVNLNQGHDKEREIFHASRDTHVAIHEKQHPNQVHKQSVP